MFFEGQNLSLINNQDRAVGNVFEKIVTPEIRKTLKQLDELPNFGDSNKVEMVGAFCGAKPVALLFQDFYMGERRPDLKKISNIINDLGLEMNIEINNEVDYTYRTTGCCEIIMSKDREKINQIINLMKEPLRNHLLMGELFGYPKSAVEAFNSRTIYPEDSYDKLHRDNATSCFCEFALSKDNYSQEIEEYGGQIEKVVKDFLPKTYKSFVKEKQNPSVEKISWWKEKKERIHMKLIDTMAKKMDQ